MGSSFPFPTNERHQDRQGAVRRLPKGARRIALEARLQDLARDLPPPLPFTAEARDWLATERARMETKGVSITVEDGMIAATAYVSSLTVVTANTKHFARFLGLRVVDWSRPDARLQEGGNAAHNRLAARQTLAVEARPSTCSPVRDALKESDAAVRGDR